MLFLFCLCNTLLVILVVETQVFTVDIMFMTRYIQPFSSKSNSIKRTSHPKVRTGMCLKKYLDGTRVHCNITGINKNLHHYSKYEVSHERKYGNVYA